MSNRKKSMSILLCLFLLLGTTGRSDIHMINEHTHSAEEADHDHIQKSFLAHLEDAVSYLLSVTAVKVYADYEDGVECEYCGGYRYDDWKCENGDHCGEGADGSCYEEHHCGYCGACDDDHELCDDCGNCLEDCCECDEKCRGCYAEGGTVCSDCHEKCSECAEWICDSCEKCPDCSGNEAYCSYCDICLDCAGNICYCGQGCEQCLDYICSGCYEKCENCADDQLCQECYTCWDCVGGEGNYCEDCGLCINCVEAICGFCGSCSSCATVCPDCNETCTNCADEDICGSCNTCKECAGGVGNFCESCETCINCAEYICSCGGGCSECAIVCQECTEKCEDCADDQICSDCGTCFDCVGGEGNYCAECGVCKNCVDYVCYCGGGCSNCAIVCPDCLEKCEACADDQICGECGTCWDCIGGEGNYCSECGLCKDCVDYVCYCGGGCSDCATVCPDCNEKCTNCADEEICGSCNTCKDCVGGDGNFCDNCETCKNCTEYVCFCGYGCSECATICPDCGEKCSECSDGEICVDCGFCDSCVGDGNFCHECALCITCVGMTCSCGNGCTNCTVVCPNCCEVCANCSDELCQECGTCRDCSDSEGFCSNCGLCGNCGIACLCGEGCEQCADICPDCGEVCSNCCDEFCASCDRCINCVEDLGFCESCMLCGDCTDICENCGVVCHDCAENACPDCGKCSGCTDEFCPDCGKCIDCADTMCENCYYCGDCAEGMCEKCGSYCTDCAAVCTECQTCENCSDTCPDCEFCVDCCEEHSKSYGCRHGICMESDEWAVHYCSEGGHCVKSSSKYTYNEYTHWKPCGEKCNARQNEGVHIWSSAKVVKEATASKEGSMEFTCIVCGYKKTEAIPKLTSGHTHVYTVTMTEVTCFSDGYTTHTCSCGHTFTDDYVPMTKHQYEYTYTETEHWKICTYCSETTGKASHKLSGWTTTLKPGYTFEGQKQRVCLTCGYTVTEAIPQLTVPNDKLVITIPGYEEPVSSDNSAAAGSDLNRPSDSASTTITKELLTKGSDQKVPALPVLPPTKDGNLFDHWENKATGETVRKGDFITENIELVPVFKDCGKDQHTDTDNDNHCDACGYIMVKELEPAPDTGTTDSEPSGGNETTGDTDISGTPDADSKMPVWLIALLSVFGAAAVSCAGLWFIKWRKSRISEEH